MRGQFIWQAQRSLIRPLSEAVILPNTVVDEGEASFLKMICHADVIDVAAGGNFYVGLTSGAVAKNDTLVQAVVNEPGATGGYARQPITRNAAGWPTTGLSNGVTYRRSATVSFTATGADYDKAITRMFLCNVASGTAGILFAISSALAVPLTVLNGNTENFNYELFCKG